MQSLLDRLSADQTAALPSHDFVDGPDRRAHRRADFDGCGLPVHRFQGGGRAGTTIGTIIDLSAGGLRMRTRQADLKPDSQVKVELDLPDYAGISPFIDAVGSSPRPARQWVGWMAISRVEPAGDGEVDVAGRLVDMDEMNRGMLSLYLSTQPMAA